MNVLPGRFTTGEDRMRLDEERDAAMTYDDRDRDMRDEPVQGEDDMRDDLELRRPTNMDDTPATTDDEGQKFEGGEDDMDDDTSSSDYRQTNL